MADKLFHCIILIMCYFADGNGILRFIFSAPGGRPREFVVWHSVQSIKYFNDFSKTIQPISTKYGRKHP